MMIPTSVDTPPGWLIEALPLLGENGADDILRERLRTTSFAVIVGALEQAALGLPVRAAINLYQAWIAAQPSNADHLFAAWFNLGVSFAHAGDRTLAATAYQNALTLRPGFLAAATNLGLVRESLGQFAGALETWGQALQPDDDRVALLNNRGRLLETMNMLEEAEQELRRSLLTRPDQPDVIQHWIYVKQKLCAWPVLSETIPGLPAANLMRCAGPLSILALTDDIATQRETARAWIQRKTPPAAGRLSPPEGYAHDRIRIGYLSSDFCRHAMSFLIAELFERHDRRRFEIAGYCIGRDDGSEIRARILKSFDHVRILGGLDDEAAANHIRADEIDILIDLNGLTAGARPGILRWKPAPIQTTYLGFIGPVPMPELDYLFCDAQVVPPEAAAAYEPAPLCIAPNYQANDSKRGIGKAGTRQAAGLPDKAFVFCCFSNYYKITEEMFDAWMEVLGRCENSVLWLAADHAKAQANMVERAAARGISGKRIIFAARVGPDDYMARLTLADLFLDTFPYNAGTIASDAIRMGLPLITRAGWSFASRMAGRLLMSVGAADGIATTPSAYIDHAVSLATNPAAYQAYRAHFGPGPWAFEIGDIGGFTAAYEQTLERIVKRAPPARNGALIDNMAEA